MLVAIVFNNGNVSCLLFPVKALCTLSIELKVLTVILHSEKRGVCASDSLLKQVMIALFKSNRIRLIYNEKMKKYKHRSVYIVMRC